MERETKLELATLTLTTLSYLLCISLINMLFERYSSKRIIIQFKVEQAISVPYGQCKPGIGTATSPIDIVPGRSHCGLSIVSIDSSRALAI